MKILYIGSTSPLSLMPLNALLKSRHTVCALAFDEEQYGGFNVIQSGSIQALAFENAIPLIRFDKVYSNALSKISAYQPDIILVSCYARRLPLIILSTAKKGSFNLHPSLLPLFRGPNPLFWQFREGLGNFGVTLHRITSVFDAGNILSQQSVTMLDGILKNEANERLAYVACELILNTLDALENENISEIAQENELASYQSYPKERDYTVSVLWTAKRIYNFIKAYKEDGVSFLCEINNEQFKLMDVFSYQNKPYKNMGNEKLVLSDENITFACHTGYIHCKIKID